MPREPRPDKSNNLTERSQGAYRPARERRGRKRRRESKPWVGGSKALSLSLEGVNRFASVLFHIYFEISILIISLRYRFVE